MSQQQVDVIIAGGGTVGSCLASGLLGNTNLRVALIESQPYEYGQQHPGYDARAIALARHSCLFLHRLGIDAIDQFGAAIKHIHVSDRKHLGQCQLHHDDYGLDYLGRVVELHELGNALHQHLAGRDTLQRFCPDSIQKVDHQPDSVEVELASGARLQGQLLVICEGGQSATKARLNVTESVTDYQQVALIANVSTRQPHNNWAYERFTAQGPVALLPMIEAGHQRERAATQQPGCGHRCSLVWTIKPEQQHQMMALPDKDFLARLQQVFGYRLGIFTQVGERLCYPLKLLKVEQPVSHRTVIVGNAAQSLHPIAGQGLNLGLRDVEALLTQLVNSANLQQDVGVHAVLAGYQAARTPDRDRVIAMTDGLVRIFSNDFLPLAAARNLGLVAMNLMPGFKRRLAMQAMGLNK